MMRTAPESRDSIEFLDEAALVVGSDGAVRAMNPAARVALPGLAVKSSLLAACPGDRRALRTYLVRCSGARQPVLTRLSLAGATGPVEMRCFGSLIAPRDQSGPASILLRLLPGHDTRFSASAERIRREQLERRCRIAIERSDELSADRLRIIEQYLFVAEALRQVERQKRELEAEIARARAEERETIAQDLHDQAGQELARVIVQVREMRDASDGERADQLESVAAQLVDVGRRLYRAAIGCRPRIVEELGLVGAIEATVKAYAADAGFVATFSVEGTPVTVAAVVESAVYRIAQEALTNIVKHAAGARNLAVRLTFSQETLVLSVADDGAGFGAGEGTPVAAMRERGPGEGLRGMRQRMTSIGGTFQIESNAGGTTVTATAKLVAAPMRILTR